jgi:hypothetical protein
MPELFAEVEAASVCITPATQTFPGTGIATPAYDYEISYDLGDSLPVVNEPDVEYEIRLSQMDTRLQSVNPITDPSYDFSGVETVRIIAFDPTAALPEVELVRYDRDPSAPSPLYEIHASGPLNVDLAPYVASGQLSLRAEYSGSLPRGDWTADVKGCFYLRVKLDYGRAMGL